MILEFAKFRDQLTSTDKYIMDIANMKFQNDARLIFSVDIPKYNKELILKWNHTEYHNMVDRIQQRTSFKSIKSFNEVIHKAFNVLFNEHFDELEFEVDHRYALYLTEYDFYLFIDIKYENLFKKLSQIVIVTLTTNTPNNIYKIIDIDTE